MHWTAQMIQIRTGLSSEITFNLQQRIPLGLYLTNTKSGLMRMKKSNDSLKRNTKATRYTSVIPAQYVVRLLPILTYVRRSGLGSETCKSKTADEIQSFEDRKDMKKFFETLKTVYGPQNSGATPLLSADGTSLLTENEAILK